MPDRDSDQSRNRPATAGRRLALRTNYHDKGNLRTVYMDSARALAWYTERATCRMAIGTASSTPEVTEACTYNLAC
jgi:hypothetical protein